LNEKGNNKAFLTLQTVL